MARLNSLMEWIDQTKKLSKRVDYMALDMIDSIMKVRAYVERRCLFKHRVFFKFFCDQYHKPNPLKDLKTERAVSKRIRKMFAVYITESIERIKDMQKEIGLQWFEIIDFIYERPELVDPSILNDEYIRSKINEVCENKKKNNPFESKMTSRLGKYWKDKDGKWKFERRKRF